MLTRKVCAQYVIRMGRLFYSVLFVCVFLLLGAFMLKAETVSFLELRMADAGLIFKRGHIKIKFELINHGFQTTLEPWYDGLIPNVVLTAEKSGKTSQIEKYHLISNFSASRKLEISFDSKYEFQCEYYLILPAGEYVLDGHLSNEITIDGKRDLASKVRLGPKKITILESKTFIDENRRK